jgi:hypothetical protein
MCDSAASPPACPELPPLLPTHSSTRIIPELIRVAVGGDHAQPIAKLLLLQVSLSEVLQVALAQRLGDVNDDLCGSLGDRDVISEDSCLGAAGWLELIVQELLLWER